MYSSVLGRFLSPDTLVPSASDPQQLNRYAYARGNPIKYTDPSGHYIFEDEPGDRSPLPGTNRTIPNVTLSQTAAQRIYGTNTRIRESIDSFYRDAGHHLTDAEFVGIPNRYMWT